MNPGLLFTHLDRPGCFHMALDRALTDNPPDRPLLRFYTWQPWTISVGFHQHMDAQMLNRADGLSIPVVRRDTGGRAVYHAEELTYSFVLPVDDPLTEDGLMPLYHKINGALLKGFERLGIAGAQAGAPVDLRQHYRTLEADICFSTSVRSEIVCEGRKLVGSAQRRFSNCVLQHGSILLGPAHERIVEVLFASTDREAALKVIQHRSIALSQVVEKVPGQEVMCAALTEGFSEQFELEFEQSEPTTELLTTVEQLRPQFRM